LRSTAAVDGAVTAMGLTVLKTPVRCPQANAFCERLIGTMRHECLDWMIVLNERHIRAVVQAWVAHYNRGRPHASLGPGIPDVPSDQLPVVSGHRKPDGHESSPVRSSVDCITNYRLERMAA
jgi:putative transposase